MGIIEVEPIKINPWQRLGRAIGRALNGEVIDRLEKLSEKVNGLEKKQNEAEEDSKEWRTNQCRNRILRFADEIRRGINHSEEFFNEILSDISAYEDYCETHPLYMNKKAEVSIKIINETFEKCTKENSFI